MWACFRWTRWTRWPTRAAFAFVEALWCVFCWSRVIEQVGRRVAMYYPVVRRGNCGAIVVGRIDWYLDGFGCLLLFSRSFDSRWRFTGSGVTAESAVVLQSRIALSQSCRAACYTITTTNNYHPLLPAHLSPLRHHTTTQALPHPQARAGPLQPSSPSHNTANMVLEATMIVYVPPSLAYRECSQEHIDHMIQVLTRKQCGQL